MVGFLLQKKAGTGNIRPFCGTRFLPRKQHNLTAKKLHIIAFLYCPSIFRDSLNLKIIRVRKNAFVCYCQQKVNNVGRL